MADTYATISTKTTPQSRPASPKQVANAAGGYTFQVSDEVRLHRFLTLGTEGGTYYVSAPELTAENADLVIHTARSGFNNRGKYLVDEIVKISEAGRAPKQNPAIFALAVAAGEGDVETRRYALSHLSRVCRTGTHLFHFIRYVENFRGWGRALCRGVAAWYENRPTDKLAYQALKYRQREGWSHRDVLRKAHPKASGPKAELFNFITGKESTLEDESLALVWDFFEMQQADSTAKAVEIIGRGNGISWEMIPDAYINEPAVWEALLEYGVPLGALLRQLPRLTRLGLAEGNIGHRIVAELTNEDRLKKARIHPVNVLIAAKTYAQGRGQGGRTWNPSGKIIDALNDAFYLAFGAVEPAGKRTLLALDCSSSMSASAGGTPISCYEAAVALSLVMAKTEPDYEIVGFANAGYTYNSIFRQHFPRVGIDRLPITPRQRLDDAVRVAKQFNWGGTDCALPMIWATANKIEVDTFVIFTDSETWAGNVHPHQALTEYRNKMGIDAALIVAAFVGTRNTIADPDDPRQLDVSGFDSAVPTLINDFSRGDL